MDLGSVGMEPTSCKRTYLGLGLRIPDLDRVTTVVVGVIEEMVEGLVCSRGTVVVVSEDDDGDIGSLQALMRGGASAGEGSEEDRDGRGICTSMVDEGGSGPTSGRVELERVVGGVIHISKVDRTESVGEGYQAV